MADPILDKTSPAALVSADISADGSPLQTTAKTSVTLQRQIQKPKADTSDGDSIANQPKGDDGVNPSALVDEAEPISIDDFVDAGAKIGDIINLPEKKEEDKVVDKAKEKIDPAEIPDSEETVEEPEKVVTDPNARDYSEIEEKHVPLFKKMGNDAFNTIKPVYLERKQLKEKLTQIEPELTKVKTELETIKKNGPQMPEDYNAHPQAFVLTPEFTQAQDQYNTLNAIHNHWDKQLDAIAEGSRTVVMLTNKLDDNGNYVEETVPVDRLVEKKITDLRTAFLQKRTTAEAKIQSLAATHQERHNLEVQKVQELRKQYFGVLYSSEDNKKTYEPIVKDTVSKLPPALRTGETGQFVAESLTLITILGNLLKAASDEKANGVKQNGKRGVIPVVATARKAAKQPTAGEAADHDGGDDNGNKKREVSFDDFQSAKNE